MEGWYLSGNLKRTRKRYQGTVLWAWLEICLTPKGGTIRDTKTLNLSRNMSKFVVRQVVSLMKNEQQSQNLLLKVDPGSTFHNNFLQLATNVFVAQQVDHAR